MRFQNLLLLLCSASLAVGALIPRSDTAPDPHQPNIIPTCTAYYKVVTGDTCIIIRSVYKNYTLPQFYSWNPDVGTDCSNLLLNYYVCINGRTPTTTTSSTTEAPTLTSSTTTTPPPSTCPPEPVPTQPGTINCCKPVHSD